MSDPDRPNDDQLIATAAGILFDEGDMEALNILLECSLITSWADASDADDRGLCFTLSGPYLSIKGLRKQTEHRSIGEDTLYNRLERAFSIILPRPYYIKWIEVNVIPFEVKENWRAELMNAIQGGNIHNQAVSSTNTKIIIWEGMRFRSQSEVRIAQALERAGVLYFPNCKARLGMFGKREVREPDFLVFSQGKWGILEVDGEPYHPVSRAVHDHARDRLFKSHGIIYIDHYDASECYKNADKVVKEFLANLAGS